MYFFFFNPENAEDIDWLNHDTQFVLYLLIIAWDILWGISLVTGLCLLFIFGKWKIGCWIIAGIVLYYVAVFLRSIYKQYRIAHPKPAMVDRKQNLVPTMVAPRRLSDDELPF